MSSVELDSRLYQLRNELDDHSRVARHLGLDFERPIKSLGDGYPENAIALVGKITERILKQLWRHHNVPGDPGGKALSELIKGAQPHIRSSSVLDSLRDIQRLRNRSTHDGYEIADEDGLTAVRRLLDVLAWFGSTGSGILTGDVPKLSPEVALKAEFLAGLYLTLDYKPVKRFELSRNTVYQLFFRERGLRSEYVELLLSKNVDDVAAVLEATGGELLQTQLPKLTRFLILEENSVHVVPSPLGEDYRIVTYDRFMDAFVDLERHLADVFGAYPELLDPAGLTISGDLLTTDERTGEQRISRVGAADQLLDEVASSGGNLLIVGRSGSGKSTLLKQLVAGSATASRRRYRFYFDMSLKARDEEFREFVTRTLAPYMAVENSYVFDVFHYFARSGSVACALDGIDEAVPSMTQEGFLELFTELAQVLSAESAVVTSSRVSFLEDSPQVRRLLDGTALVSEKLVQQLHAQGVNPLRVPRFSALRLQDATDAGTPLELRLARELELEGGDDRPHLVDLAWRHMTRVASSAGLTDALPSIVAYFGSAFLRGRTTFTFVELVNELGISLFEGGRLTYDAFRLKEFFRPVDSSGIAFAHSAYQELLAAEHLRDPAGRESAVEAGPRLTEQVREFLYRRSRQTPQAPADDCVLPTGAYLVGPSHHLMLRRVERPVRFDRFPVTVSRYNRFLEAVREHGSQQWDHPDKPPEFSHEPWQERLKVQEYFTDPAYENHPAICVNYWSAHAFARFEGKRLPTSLEWEAAARGGDGRLFPWGDDIDLDIVNCADSWSGRPLITYEAWREELDQGRLSQAMPGPVDAHPANVSPFGVREMAGNVWEITGTVLENLNEVVICGGSYDNPYRALQVSSKGLSRRRGCSNAVGFRCVEELG
ncbi:SUMF1/EgtB/PvdO family nonheme iron enzyme [Streptosporangium sp. NPDC002721]|uniref:SUMF1/EgtB/PvdO family nonheme iron enzyme n=1 Tax=Streptosporangium sp. NPDC002721 TaxID=3366188 RepID=UPI0036B9040D